MAISVATVKRLFAVSGNQCAFPKCQTPLVDAGSGKVTGRIAHIKGQSVGGPRYDHSQADEERHSFDNLLLLCPIHHDVIDSDIESYSVQRLMRIKREHEAGRFGGLEPSDSIVQQFIANITAPVITHGSIIFSHNQMGGQIAHSITNIGPHARTISQAAAGALISELLKYPAETFGIATVMSDADGLNLATAIAEILTLGGWKTDGGVAQGLFHILPRGLTIQTPIETPALKIFLNWCNAVGLSPKGVVSPGLSRTEIVVGLSLPSGIQG